MKKFLLQNSTSKVEYAAILAGEAWLGGIIQRSSNPYLDLLEPSEDECMRFLSQFVESCSQMLYTYEEMFNRHTKKNVGVIVSHIDENTSSDLIAESARKANINLKNIPTYSYTKFYFTANDTIWVDINTNEENKRDAYSITQVGSHNFEVKKFEPEHGVELLDFISKIDDKQMTI